MDMIHLRKTFYLDVYQLTAQEDLGDLFDERST